MKLKSIFLLLLIIIVFISNYLIIPIIKNDPVAVVTVTGIYIIIYIKLLQLLDNKA